MALARHDSSGIRGNEHASVAREKAHAAIDDAQQAIHHSVEAVKARAYDLESGLRERAASASATLREQAGQVRASAARAYEASATAVRDGVQAGKRGLAASTAACRHSIEERPFTMVAGAIATGFVLGWAIGRRQRSVSIG